MGYTLTIHIGAVNYSLSDNFGIVADSGLGKSPVSRKETRAAQQHGSTDRGRTLSPRVFSLGFSMNGSTFRGYWDARDTLIRVFKSTEDLFELRWTFDNGDIRSLDCAVIDGLTFPSNRRSGFSDSAVVTFKANDPTFYDPTEISEVFALGGGGDAMVIPLTIPWPVGASTINQTKQIDYTGSWQTSPIIKIEGPIENPIVTNLLTDEKISFQGTTIGAGDYYEIDTRDGIKTVIDASAVNRIANLSDDSDLGTFHLETPILNNALRVNDIKVTGGGLTTATEVYVRYNTRYEGI